MTHDKHCNPLEHTLSRRQVLGAGAAGAVGLGFGGLTQPAIAEELKKSDKQVLLMWLDGGMSQLESWDPKPNTPYGGPYRSIATSLPGVHVSELMPRVSQQMHHLAVVRSMKTEDPNHSSGVPKILRGHPKNRGVTYPYMGSAVAKLMGPMESGLPPYVWVKPGNGGFISKHAGFLGAKHGAFAIGSGKPPSNLARPDGISEEFDAARQELRERFNRRYAKRHRPTASEANAYVFDVAQTLMKHTDLFDESTLPQKDKERYGDSELGRNTLLGRRLLEAGVRFVHVQSYGWDTHGDNFNAHASRMPKVDQSLSALLEDLHDRSMLDNVLVVVMAEFGRTPRVNGSVGRDHWPNAWSLAMTGTGIQRGLVVGETLPDGTDVATEPYDIGAMFHTWYRALGVHDAEFMNGTQPLPIAHDDMKPVEALLT
ncbi:MAG TPA: DUF1501 domain-containing protein [Planctomycetaceae bacterium]|nr:DUF1501 domain-containing protein [Planctomycetaceae bacterium]